jgi:hypothetical protein
MIPHPPRYANRKHHPTLILSGNAGGASLAAIHELRRRWWVSTITRLQVRDDLPAHDGLELPRADLARLVAQRAVARHAHEVRLGHVDPVVLREKVREGSRRFDPLSDSDMWMRWSCARRFEKVRESLTLCPTRKRGSGGPAPARIGSSHMERPCDRPWETMRLVEEEKERGGGREREREGAGEERERDGGPRQGLSMRLVVSHTAPTHRFIWRGAAFRWSCVRSDSSCAPSHRPHTSFLPWVYAYSTHRTDIRHRASPSRKHHDSKNQEMKSIP